MDDGVEALVGFVSSHGDALELLEFAEVTEAWVPFRPTEDTGSLIDVPDHDLDEVFSAIAADETTGFSAQYISFKLATCGPSTFLSALAAVAWTNELVSLSACTRARVASGTSGPTQPMASATEFRTLAMTFPRRPDHIRTA